MTLKSMLATMMLDMLVTVLGTLTSKLESFINERPSV